MIKKDLTWKEVRENLKLTKEQEEEIRVEEEVEMLPTQMRLGRVEREKEREEDNIT